MTVEETALKGVFVIKPRIFQDARGYFFESFHAERFATETGHHVAFVQDNESCSQKNVLRGLHFQVPPYGQGKLVRVVQGAVLDVAVDLRKASPTFGKHVAIELSAENKYQLYIPEGFAHGFLTLQDNTIFSYKCTGYYNKEAEGAIHFADEHLGISWPVSNPQVSDKDAAALPFNKFNSPF